MSKRVALVYKLLVQGVTRADILQNAAKLWGVRDRVADEYIARARKMIQADAAKIRETALDDMLTRHADLRKRAYSSNDLRLILDADNFDAKLLGLFKRTSSSQVNINWSDLTNEQLDRIAAGEDPLDVIASDSRPS